MADKVNHFVFRFLNAMVDGGVWARIDAMARAVAIAYLRHADCNGLAYPGNDLLESETGMSDRAVRKGRTALVKAGILQIIDAAGGRQKPVIAKLVIPQTRADSAPLSEDTNPEPVVPPLGDKPGTSDTLNAELIRHERRNQYDTKGGTGSSTEGHKERHNEGHINNTGGEAVVDDGGVLKFLRGITGLNMTASIKALAKELTTKGYNEKHLGKEWKTILGNRGLNNRPGALINRMKAMLEETPKDIADEIHLTDSEREMFMRKLSGEKVLLGGDFANAKYERWLKQRREKQAEDEWTPPPLDPKLKALIISGWQTEDLDEAQRMADAKPEWKRLKEAREFPQRTPPTILKLGGARKEPDTDADAAPTTAEIEATKEVVGEEAHAELAIPVVSDTERQARAQENRTKLLQALKAEELKESKGTA